LRWFSPDGEDRLLLVNLGRDFDWNSIAEPLIAGPRGRRWVYAWSSEEPRYGGLGIPHFADRKWRVTGHAAVLLVAALQ
jgi:maltooligosyltrehalose trehalohydrolase